MVEQDTRAAEHVVSLTIFLHNPESVQLCHRIRRVGVERSILVLWHFLHLSVQFRCRSLIYSAAFSQSAQTHSLQHTEHTCCIHIGSKLRRVERHLHMALCSQVIHLGRAHLAHHLHNAHRVPQVRIVQMEVRFSFQMRYSLPVIHGRASDSAVHVITLFQ